jgi:hypothetical protein
MINDVIRHLQKASVRPNDFTSRYSQLLERLWQRKDGEPRMNNSTTNLPDSHGFVVTPSRPAPQYNHQQNEFSWLDLQAVGELVTGDHDNGFGMDGYTQFMTMAGDWGDLSLMDGEDVNRFF